MILKTEIGLAPEKLGAADREKLKRAEALFRLAE
jgi:hypothetical protein